MKKNPEIQNITGGPTSNQSCGNIVHTYTVNTPQSLHYKVMLMRDEEGRKEGRKKQARPYKQKSNTTHPSLF